MSDISYSLVDRATLEDEGKDFIADVKHMANCCLGVYQGFSVELDELETEKKGGKAKLLKKKGKYDDVVLDADWTLIKDFDAPTGPKKEPVLIAQFGTLGKDYVVVCRGTQTTEEWRQNAKAGMTKYMIDMGRAVNHGKVHKGFYQVYGAFRSALMEEIRAVYRTLESGSGTRLLITGHSLGGALATLTTYEIGVRFGDRFNVIMHNFASPRVSGNTWRDNFHKTITDGYRFVNTKDLVPDVPPAAGPDWWSYHHVGQPFAFTGDTRRVDKQHDMFYYQSQLDEPDTWIMTKQ